MSIIISILLIVGVIVALIGTIGCFRFDNFLARTHAASVVDTFATLLIILGLMFHYGFSLFSLKLLLILVKSPLINLYISMFLVTSLTC